MQQRNPLRAQSSTGFETVGQPGVLQPLEHVKLTVLVQDGHRLPLEEDDELDEEDSEPPLDDELEDDDVVHIR